LAGAIIACAIRKKIARFRFRRTTSPFLFRSVSVGGSASALSGPQTVTNPASPVAVACRQAVAVAGLATPSAVGYVLIRSGSWAAWPPPTPTDSPRLQVSRALTTLRTGGGDRRCGFCLSSTDPVPVPRLLSADRVSQPARKTGRRARAPSAPEVVPCGRTRAGTDTARSSPSETWEATTLSRQISGQHSFLFFVCMGRLQALQKPGVQTVGQFSSHRTNAAICLA
jgi:hypothetical protein